LNFANFTGKIDIDLVTRCSNLRTLRITIHPWKLQPPLESLGGFCEEPQLERIFKCQKLKLMAVNLGYISRLPLSDGRKA
jgi:hypothetical protein